MPGALPCGLQDEDLDREIGVLVDLAHVRAIPPTFHAAVERATGRRVIGFASHVQLEEPRFMAEIFRLEAR